MESLETAVEAVSKLYELVSSSELAVGFMSAGLLLVAVTVLMAVKITKSEPKKIPIWMRVAFFSCLGCSLALVATSPAVSWIELTRYGIAKVSFTRSFENLRSNSRVTWLIRLVAYNKDDKTLSVSHLTQLGPASQLYTFVANYHELRGYTVRDAVRMAGGNIRDGQHVSAVIFPVRFDLTPANAKGLLQIVDEVQSNNSVTIEKRLDMSWLHGDELTNMRSKGNLALWAWDGYGQYYPRFCELAQSFRCEDYSAKRYIGGINQDWMPLGFSRRVPSADDRCGADKLSVCRISDWTTDTRKYQVDFGARVFLVKNFAISELEDPYLIDFEQPNIQIIPDIGVPDPSR